MESDIFDQQGDDCSGEEEGEGVFDGEVVLFFGVGGVFLEVGDEVQEPRNHKFVDDGDGEGEKVGEGSCCCFGTAHVH